MKIILFGNRDRLIYFCAAVINEVISGAQTLAKYVVKVSLYK